MGTNNISDESAKNRNKGKVMVVVLQENNVLQILNNKLDNN